MPTRDFNRRLAQLVRGGGSTAAIGRQLRSEGFRVGNDRLRGFVNALRGRRITAGQLLSIRTSLGPVPTAVEVTVSITASYSVTRSEFGRGTQTLLSGTVTGRDTLTVPIGEDTNQRINTQAGALLEDEVQQRVRDVGLAQAGDYLEPQITGRTIEIVGRRFVNFI